MMAATHPLVRALLQYAAATALALFAGFGAALVLNVLLFRACGYAPCDYAAGAWARNTPGLAAAAVAGWHIARVATWRWAIPVAAVVGVMLVVSGAPLSSTFPLTGTRWPGDFVLSGPFRALASIPVLPIAALWSLPYLVITATVTLLFALANRTSSRAVRWNHVLSGAAVLASGLVAEYLVAPRAWSPGVHRRIAGLDLRTHAGAQGTHYRGWASAQLHYRVPATVETEDVLDFHATTFEGWRTVDRTYQDAIWVDPSGDLFAWVYVVAPKALPRERLVYASVRDVDRALWQHALRRTTSGRRIGELVNGH